MVKSVAPATRRVWYRRLPRWAWALIAGGLLLLLLLFWRLTSRPVVTLVPVQRGRVVAAVYAPGTVRSGTETVVAANASGRVVALYLSRGNLVTPGQVVARLDDSQARLQLQEAQAAVTAAQTQVAQAQAGVEAANSRVQTARQNVLVLQEERVAAEERIAAAQAEVARTEAQVADARDNLDRYERLYAAGAISERQVVQARTTVRTAEATAVASRANLQVARQGVAQAQASVEAAQAQVGEAVSAAGQARAAQAQAQAGVAQAQSRMAQAQETLANYTVRSLVGGTVSDVPVEVGTYVAAGAPVARVVSVSQLYVEADVDEEDIDQVAVGQTAYFTTDALPNRTFQGMVTEIGASADPTTNTYPVEVRRMLMPAGLRVQMSVDVNIVTRQTANAVLAPAAAVVLTPAPHVWLVDDQSRLRYRPVVVGARNLTGSRVEIRQGLSEGTLVVSHPQSTFREGQRVRVASR